MKKSCQISNANYDWLEIYLDFFIVETFLSHPSIFIWHNKIIKTN